MDVIGVVSEPDHPTFSRVGERLAARGFDVRFLPPTEPLHGPAIDGLDAFVNTAIRPDALAAVRYADAADVETWNGFLPSVALSSRLVALEALEAVGCEVPEVWLEAPDEPAVERRRFRWALPANDDRATFYQEPVTETREPVRYYAVEDGVETHVTAMRVRRSVTDGELAYDEADVEVERATRVRELLHRFGGRALDVTFARAGGTTYAVDVNVAPTFLGTDLERRVADSWASLATIGA